jgi:type II secretory pathway component GspD/PulD (secretin)
MTLGASYLNDLQVDLLVTATQAKRTGITLTAPRLTFFNGQRAYVLVGRQVSFISGLTPVQNTNSATPTISSVQSGVVLDVEGTTSADRRYVTMTLRPSLANLKDPIRQIEIRAANQIINNNNNNNTGTGTGGLGGLLGTSGTQQQGTILGIVETPELELTQVRTTVSVPDRGTLMTGGQRLIAETQVEAGVPVLSKIPLIDRLFANSTQVKDERTLLILIKPTIILQNEEEESRWPGGPQDWSAFNVTGQPAVER